MLYPTVHICGNIANISCVYDSHKRGSGREEGERGRGKREEGAHHRRSSPSCRRAIEDEKDDVEKEDNGEEGVFFWGGS